MSTLIAVLTPWTWNERRRQRQEAETRRIAHYYEKCNEFFNLFGFFPENIEEPHSHTQTMLYFARLAKRIRDQQNGDSSRDERQFTAASELIRFFHPDLAASMPHWSTMHEPDVVLEHCRRQHDPQMRALKHWFVSIGD